MAKETMVMSMFFNFMFPPPPSIFVTAMSIISFVALANYGISEIRGKHLNYSKFWNANNNKTNSGKQIKLSSKVGMLLLYTPAFLAGAVSFWIFPNEGLRSTLLQGALTLHYFKRVFEVILYTYGLTPPSRFLFSLNILMISFNLRPT